MDFALLAKPFEQPFVEPKGIEPFTVSLQGRLATLEHVTPCATWSSAWPGPIAPAEVRLNPAWKTTHCPLCERADSNRYQVVFPAMAITPRERAVQEVLETHPA